MEKDGDKTIIAIKTYDKIAEVYAKKFFGDTVDLKYLDKFLSFLPQKAKVLDVGCGPGGFTKYMMEKGFSVEGIDLSKSMIKVARKMVPQGIFKIMDMRKLKYPNQSFDGLCTAYSLVHISSKQVPSTLEELSRVLKPNGFIIFMLQEGKGEKMISEPFGCKRKMFIKCFEKNEIKNLLEEKGFEIVYEAERNPKINLELKRKKLFVIAKKSNSRDFIQNRSALRSANPT